MGVVLSLDIQTHCSVRHAASDLPMSYKDCPMPLKLKVEDCNCRAIKPVGATQLKSLKRNRYRTLGGYMFIYSRHPTCVRAQTEAPVLVDEVGLP
jgi:hypothetical protein